MPEREKGYFNQNLRFLRKERGLTLVSLSEKTGISKSSISEYEKGTSYPGLQVLEIFSSFFSKSIDDLLNKQLVLTGADDEDQHKNQAVPEKSATGEILQHEKYQFHLQLLQQRLEASAQRCQMFEQLLKSRESENKTLRIQIRLLEERLQLMKQEV
jgi:transcriptional regulator with XRE-family HTH domain